MPQLVLHYRRSWWHSCTPSSNISGYFFFLVPNYKPSLKQGLKYVLGCKKVRLWYSDSEVWILD